MSFQYELEKELKVLLNKEEYNSLLKQFDWDEVRSQTNYYYTDDKDLIKNKGITVRIRECNNIIALQVKVPLHEEGAFHMKKEFETYIKDVPKVIEGSIISNLCSIDLPNVTLAGSLVTKRHICKLVDGIEICLDKSKYFDIEDYELEIEYEENIDPLIFDILNKNKIKYHNNVEGKSRRFFNYLETKPYKN
ncbi:MAG: CYTH domain-containing protein [Clostridiales bacterium]|nr:CYTH domain-containing protein [Clostridiales bacterium]